jgi:Domain of unknown function (DUF4412)
MKKYFLMIAIAVLGSSLVQAQMPSAGLSPGMSDAMAKVFGTNLYFSASLRTEIKMEPQNQNVSMSGKMYFSGGDSRTEMDMTKMTGDALPPEALAQMKAMGMDKMVSISQNEQKTLYVIYPNLHAYTKMQEPGTSGQTNSVTIKSVDLGKETVDGHSCVKKQYSLTDPTTGQTLTMTLWTATDLKNIPLQVQQETPGNGGSGTNFMTMHYTDINVTPPDASLFTAPAGYTPYSDVQTMMQNEMMKKMGGAGAPPQ